MNKLLKEANQMLKFWCLDAEPTLDGYKFEDPKEIEKAIKEVEKSDHPDMQYLMALKRALELAKAERATKDNDATENGAIKEFGQSKETEVMPLEKKPVLAQDGDSLVGKNVWVRNKGQEWRVYVLQDKGDKLYIHDPYNGTQGWISRSDVTGLAGTGTKDDKFGTVMKEFYEGKLKSSSGKTVTDPQQAKAIAYSESEDEGPVYTFGGQFKKIGEIQKEINDLESKIFEKEEELKGMLSDAPHPENKKYNPYRENIHKLKGRLEKAKKELANLKSGGKMTKDEKTYQNGEHVKVKNHGTGEEIDLKVLKDNKDGTLEVKAPTGAVITVKKTWIVDSSTVIDECMEVLKLSGFATDAEPTWQDVYKYFTNASLQELEKLDSKDKVISFLLHKGAYGKFPKDKIDEAIRRFMDS